MSVTLLEVMAAAEARRAPLVAELAGYLVLGAADQSAGATRRLRAAEVVLAEDGTVRIGGNGEACGPGEAEASLRRLLQALMRVASSVTPALLRSSRREAGGGVDALIRELETALIPVNRAAARRALSRLQRETTRALESGRVDVVAFEEREIEPAAQRFPAAPAVAPRPAPAPLPVATPTLPEPEAESDESSASSALPGSRACPVPPPMPHTPVLGTLCDSAPASRRVDCAEVDVTDRVPPVFKVEEPDPVEPGLDPTRRAPLVEPVRLAVFDDEEVEWIEVEPSAELPVAGIEVGIEPPVAEVVVIDPEPCVGSSVTKLAVGAPLSSEPFCTAPSADPPGVMPRSRPSVVVSGGLGTLPETEPGPSVGEADVCDAPEPEPTPSPGVSSPVEPAARFRFAPRRSDVSDLLASFVVLDSRSDRELGRDLKQMAGLDPTTPPPSAAAVGNDADDPESADGVQTAFEVR